MLGGGIATDITVIVVLAAIALIVIAAYNGLRNLLYSSLRRDRARASVSRES